MSLSLIVGVIAIIWNEVYKIFACEGDIMNSFESINVLVSGVG